jgi:DNA-binding transcriptional MerR regulator
MPVVIKGNTYYRTSEACRLAGITRSTLLRWIAADITQDASSRDRRGWRLFSQADIERIEAEAGKTLS